MVLVWELVTLGAFFFHFGLSGSCRGEGLSVKLGGPGLDDFLRSLCFWLAIFQMKGLRSREWGLFQGHCLGQFRSTAHNGTSSSEGAN